ncbi:unnamed protein product [Rodentolepis nana]|uniref:Uncharacterized protein n=1 Tax=Rodentolepis nana TaxID=102285 RepID=A0A3P7VJR3_RODNA|nr:unnamed protein product [Rodentolepis nana]
MPCQAWLTRRRPTRRHIHAIQLAAHCDWRPVIRQADLQPQPITMRDRDIGWSGVLWCVCTR